MSKPIQARITDVSARWTFDESMPLFMLIFQCQLRLTWFLDNTYRRHRSRIARMTRKPSEQFGTCVQIVVVMSSRPKSSWTARMSAGGAHADVYDSLTRASAECQGFFQESCDGSDSLKMFPRASECSPAYLPFPQSSQADREISITAAMSVGLRPIPSRSSRNGLAQLSQFAVLQKILCDNL